jgi:hypothetical protein
VSKPYSKKHRDEYVPWEDPNILNGDSNVNEETREWADSAETLAEECATQSVRWALGAAKEDPMRAVHWIELSRIKWQQAKDAGW